MLVGWTQEGIYTWDWDKQAAPHLTWKLPVEWTLVRWSPDGKTLAAPAPEGIYLWDASTPEGVQIPLAISESSGVSGVEFSPDNRTLAAALKGGGIVIYDLGDPKASRRTLNLQSLYVTGFSPDGRWLITSGSGNTVISDLQQPQRTPLALPGWRVGYGSFSPQVAFSPDGKYMAADTKEGKVELWDLNSLTPGKAPGPPIKLASNMALPSPGPAEYVPEDQQAQLVPAIAFSAGGQRLTVAGMDRYVKQWNVADLSDPGKAAAAKPTIIMSPPDPEGFYAITYQWSHFNEDFGEIKPPPTETIK
jgi:WD40 repeat protein